LTAEALRRIAELYVIETDIRGRSSHERRLVRQARAKPLLDDLERWLHAALDKLSRKSDTSALCRAACRPINTPGMVCPPAHHCVTAGLHPRALERAPYAARFAMLAALTMQLFFRD
jgi:hypothetical protein